MNGSCPTCKWVMSHIWMSHVSHTNGSCHTWKCVPHVWMRNVTHTWMGVISVLYDSCTCYITHVCVTWLMCVLYDSCVCCVVWLIFVLRDSFMCCMAHLCVIWLICVFTLLSAATLYPDLTQETLPRLSWTPEFLRLSPHFKVLYLYLSKSLNL